MSGAGSVFRLPSGTAGTPATGPEEALTRAWAALERERGQLHAAATEVAFSLAARVLEACAAQERLIAIDALRAALEAELGSGIRLARVHPVDLAACEAVVTRSGASVRVHADASLRPGDVVLEGPAGIIDARLTARLEALRASLESVA